MRILGPLPWPTISPVTVTLASAAASLVTVSPSTSRIAGRVTVSPASPVRRFTVNRSPTATLCWLPPAFTTAYTTDSSFVLLVSSLFPRARPVRDRVLDGLRTLHRRHRRAPRRERATRPAYPSGASRVDRAPGL